MSVLTDMQRAVLRDIHGDTSVHVDEMIADGEFPRHQAFAQVNTALQTMPRGLTIRNDRGEVYLTREGCIAIGVEW